MPPRAWGSGVPGDGREWTVRPVPGASARKVYRCPWCDHEVTPGLPHVVAWPDEDFELRRHWHTACWRRAVAQAERRARRRAR